MGVCSFCGKGRARFTLFVGTPQPEDTFEHLYGEELGGTGRYINHHAKCLPRKVALKVTVIGNLANYDWDNHKRWGGRRRKE